MSCHIIRCLSFHESRTIPYYSILFHICPYSSPVRRMILICPIKISLFLLENHWIGLRENLQETMVFTCFYHQIDRAFRWNMFPSSNSMFLMFLMFLSFWISAKHLNYASVLDGVILRHFASPVLWRLRAVRRDHARHGGEYRRVKFYWIHRLIHRWCQWDPQMMAFLLAFLLEMMGKLW